MLKTIRKEWFNKLSLKKVQKFFRNRALIKQMTGVPIIIGGAPRSGTTLLLAVLGAHPDIHAESYETMAFSLVRPNEDHAANHKKNMDKFLSYLITEDIKPTAKRWCEKTPNNIHHIKWILGEFNNRVKIIHIIRDGRDVVTSQHPTRPDEYFVSPEGWVKSVRHGLAYKDNPNVYTVKYEDLVEHYEETVKDLLHFLDLEWFDDLREFNKQTTVTKNIAFEGEQVQGLYKSSVKKWQKPEHQAQIDKFYANAEAMALLEQLGYDTSR